MKYFIFFIFMSNAINLYSIDSVRVCSLPINIGTLREPHQSADVLTARLALSRSTSKCEDLDKLEKVVNRLAKKDCNNSGFFRIVILLYRNDTIDTLAINLNGEIYYKCCTYFRNNELLSIVYEFLPLYYRKQIIELFLECK